MDRQRQASWRRPPRTVYFAIAILIASVWLAVGLEVAHAAPLVHKSYVCKYVGTPGVDETLQTGQNPIWVDNHSLLGHDGTTYVGQQFTDAQGRSIVIVANTPKLDPEPTVDDCPGTPPPPPPPPVNPDADVYMVGNTCDAPRASVTVSNTGDVDLQWYVAIENTGKPSDGTIAPGESATVTFRVSGVAGNEQHVYASASFDGKVLTDAEGDFAARTHCKGGHNPPPPPPPNTGGHHGTNPPKSLAFTGLNDAQKKIAYAGALLALLGSLSLFASRKRSVA